MLRVASGLNKLRCYKSVYRLVSEYIRDERLRQVFTFEPLLIGGNPFRCSGIYLLIHWLERKWGVHYARGGTTAIVSALGRLLDELGVDVRLNSPVSSMRSLAAAPPASSWAGSASAPTSWSATGIHRSPTRG